MWNRFVVLWDLKNYCCFLCCYILTDICGGDDDDLFWCIWFYSRVMKMFIVSKIVTMTLFTIRNLQKCRWLWHFCKPVLKIAFKLIPSYTILHETACIGCAITFNSILSPALNQYNLINLIYCHSFLSFFFLFGISCYLLLLRSYTKPSLVNCWRFLRSWILHCQIILSFIFLSLTCLSACVLACVLACLLELIDTNFEISHVCTVIITIM